MVDKLEEVTIYTDGACIDNPGQGGYGVVILYESHREELSGGFSLTTNNRMEIIAAIVGLRYLKMKSSVTIYSDSQYLVYGIEKGWAKKWKTNNWKRKGGKAINPDLWEQLLDLCSQHEVEFKWVRGHSGNVENERCDQLALQAATQEELPPDTGYKNNELE